MNFLAVYLFLYKEILIEANAGDTLRTLITHRGDIHPLRYPHRFHSVVQLAFLWFILSFEKLTSFYDHKLGPV